MQALTADVIHPAIQHYNGKITDAALWSNWTPRQGDILVCTPAKCGTTWTQTILSMLVNGGPDLPDRLSVLSPWVDAGFDGVETVAEALSRQTGRRVVKTHTPADGFPVWDGVQIIFVYRHPLDAFFSLRKHIANMVGTEGHPMREPLESAFAFYLDTPGDPQAVDTDSLGTYVMHYTQSASRPGKTASVWMHYADMLADPHAAVTRLAAAANLPADPALTDAIARATSLDAMRAKGPQFAPEGGKGFWNDDTAFFDSGGTNKWRDRLSDAQVAAYTARFAELLPDPAARRWLESGGQRPE